MKACHHSVDEGIKVNFHKTNYFLPDIYLILDNAFQYCCHSCQRLTLLLHFTHMSKMCHILIVLIKLQTNMSIRKTLVILIQ